MLFPSKVTSFNESIFRILLTVAMKLRRRTLTVSELVGECKAESIPITDMFSAIDVLYALKKLDYQNGELIYVE